MNSSRVESTQDTDCVGKRNSPYPLSAQCFADCLTRLLSPHRDWYDSSITNYSLFSWRISLCLCLTSLGKLILYQTWHFEMHRVGYAGVDVWVPWASCTGFRACGEFNQMEVFQHVNPGSLEVCRIKFRNDSLWSPEATISWRKLAFWTKHCAERDRMH